jgi:Clr5 domain
MVLIGNAGVAGIFAEVRTMVTDSTRPAGADCALSLVRYSSKACEETLFLEGGNLVSRTDKTPSSGDWEAIRSIFTYYYIEKGYPLHAVRTFMARHHSFHAT